MNTLSDFEISELATRLVCGEFEIRLEANSKLDTLDTNMRSSVYKAACTLAEERLHQARESQDPNQIFRELEYAAEMAHGSGDYMTARAMIDECIDMEKRHKRGWPWTFSTAACMLQEHDDLNKAREYQEEAVKIARNETKMDGLTGEMLYHLGTIAAPTK